MAYTEFETEKAKYVFLAGFHSSSNPSAGKLQGIDALVLEGSKLVSCRLNFNFRKYAGLGKIKDLNQRFESP
ncbi:hypothetical protein J4479_03410 [Candidatus Woesearchaeota archaeon]|nr:hypothetical protein [Candidatus Woesearchaeota archaeon]